MAINPAPLPTAWGAHVVDLPDNRKAVALAIETPAGKTVVFIDADSALKLSQDVQVAAEQAGADPATADAASARAKLTLPPGANGKGLHLPPGSGG